MEEKETNWPRRIVATLTTIVLIRLLTLGMPDLIDTTEGRYATTSQLMLERGDWVTPWIIFKGIEEPYLGKPPLHFWLINTCYELFGLSNFSARLPSLLSAIVIGCSLFILSNTLLSRRAAFVGTLVFATSVLTFFLGGACLLDVTLTAGITLAMAGWALADRSVRYGYLCFIGLAIGVLVKGPAGVVFFCAAAGPWLLLQRFFTGRWPAQLRALPWVPGLTLFIALCVPWYLLAETRNPGFLKYFLWNENIGRFFSKDYGDEYGMGHVQLRGAAFVIMIPALAPWTVALLGTLFERRRELSLSGFYRNLRNDQWLLLGLTWTLSCPLLLLFARQYTPTYIMSSIPGFAFLAAVAWQRWTKEAEGAHLVSHTTARLLGVIMGLTVIIASIVFHLKAPSITALICACIIGALILGLSIFMRKPCDSVGTFASVALLTAIGYGGAIIAAHEHLSTHRSTRNILNYASRFTKGESATIGFAGNLPFSARFYSALIPHPKTKVSQVDGGEAATASEDLIIVRKKKGQNDFITSVPDRVQVGELGRWRVYAKKSTTQ